MAFECDKCGLCCCNLRKFGGLYNDLDDGTGVCRHYDPLTKLCTIYENRPLKCRVDDFYLQVAKDTMTYEEYIEGNKRGCEELKKEQAAKIAAKVLNS